MSNFDPECDCRDCRPATRVATLSERGLFLLEDYEAAVEQWAAAIDESGRAHDRACAYNVVERAHADLKAFLESLGA
jgi:hypothetical protein